MRRGDFSSHFSGLISVLISVLNAERPCSKVSVHSRCGASQCCRVCVGRGVRPRTQRRARRRAVVSCRPQYTDGSGVFSRTVHTRYSNHWRRVGVAMGPSNSPSFSQLNSRPTIQRSTVNASTLRFLFITVYTCFTTALKLDPCVTLPPYSLLYGLRTVKRTSYVAYLHKTASRGLHPTADRRHRLVIHRSQS